MRVFIDGPPFSGKTAYAKFLERNSSIFKYKKLFVGREFYDTVMQKDINNNFITVFDTGLLHQLMMCDKHELGPFLKWDNAKLLKFYLKIMYEGSGYIILLPTLESIKERYYKWITKQDKVHISLEEVYTMYYEFVDYLDIFKRYIPNPIIVESKFSVFEIKKKVQNSVILKQNYLNSLAAPAETWGNAHKEQGILFVAKENKGNTPFIFFDEDENKCSKFILETMSRSENYKLFILTTLIDRITGKKNDLVALVNKLRPSKVVVLGLDTWEVVKKLEIKSVCINEPMYYRRLSFSSNCIESYLQEIKGALYGL